MVDTSYFKAKNTKGSPSYTNHLERDMDVCTKCYGNPSNSYGDILHKKHKLIVALDEKLKDDQNQWDSSFRDHECLFKISFQSVH